MRVAQGVAAALFAGVMTGCAGGDGHATDQPAADTAAAEAPAAAATPVQMARAERALLDLTVGGPGRTEARRQDRVRAPFPSRLVSLRVTDGDRVASGQIVAQVVSKNSQAALEGAQAMLRDARTGADSADARRAMATARRNLVVQPLHAPAAGMVLSHSAEEGDYLDEGEVLLTIAEAGAVFFDAQVAQTDVARVQPGQRATVDIPAIGATGASAVVHGLLPSASSQNLSAPVRLDFSPPRPDLSIGLFGTARIVVAERRNVIVVPDAAVLANDVTGTTRMAVVGADGRAHWIDVQAGLRDGARVEIVSPAIAVGERVIVSGQVGLPDGTRVRAMP